MNFPTEQQVEAVARMLATELHRDGNWNYLESYEQRDYLNAARIALTALAPEWREMEADKTRLDWCERQATDGLHIELCYSGSYSGMNLEKGATVFMGDEQHRCDNVRAAIDDAREREKQS